MTTTLPTATHHPSFGRRLGASLYEMILLFGIVFISAFVLQALATMTRTTLPVGMYSVALWLMMGLYFVYCWRHGGQTLAQRTWHLHTQTRDGQRVGLAQAWWRYSLAYIGFLPACVLMWAYLKLLPNPAGAAHTYSLFIFLALINWMALLGTAGLHPRRWTLHEWGSATQTVYKK